MDNPFPKIFSSSSNKKLVPHEFSYEKPNTSDKTTSLKTWIKFLNNRDLVKHRFLCFLFGTVDDKTGSNFYIEKLKLLFSFNEKILLLSFLHLVIGDPLLAIWLIDEPEEFLHLFEESCNCILADIFFSFTKVKENVKIKVFELPIFNSIRNLRADKIKSLVKIKGVVVSKTVIHPQLKFFRLNCLKCFELQKSIYSISKKERIIYASCFNCKSSGPFQVNWSQTEHSDYQKISIQELSYLTPIGCIPYRKEIFLKNNLINIVKLGEEIIVTGILKYNFELNVKYLSNIGLFSTYIDANHIEFTKGLTQDFIFTNEEEENLNLVFKKRKILDFFLSSMAPSIYCKKNFRLPLLISLFGGQTREVESNILVKNNINVLIIGNPGTGKSEILKSIEKLIPKSLLVNNQESRKKLIPSLKFEKSTDEWMLQRGSLFFIDKGFCLIDEVDMIDARDYFFLNRVMDQQSLCLQKDEIFESLKIRCSIIATVSHLATSHKLNLSSNKDSMFKEEFFSKFDVQLTLDDNHNSLTDEILSKFVIESHLKGQYSSSWNENVIKKKTQSPYRIKVYETNLTKHLSAKLFRKYIIYARHYVRPKLNESSQDSISNIYAFMRKENFSKGGTIIVLRHLESLIRIIEACARLHLREITSKKDVSIGVSVFLTSFFDSQPTEIKNVLKQKYKKYLDPLQLIFENCLKVLNDFFYPKKKKKNMFLQKRVFEKKLEKISIKKQYVTKFFRSKNFLTSDFRVDFSKNIIFFAQTHF